MKKQGKVVRWDEQRGFGFIRCNSTSQDIFFHIRDCAGGLQTPSIRPLNLKKFMWAAKAPEP